MSATNLSKLTSLPVGLRLALAEVPEWCLLDVAATAMLVRDAHPNWTSQRIVRRARSITRGERIGRYDAGRDRRASIAHESQLTDRRAAELAASAAELAGGNGVRTAVTLSLIRALEHGETIASCLMAGDTRADIAARLGVAPSTVCRWLARVHGEAATLLSETDI